MPPRSIPDIASDDLRDFIAAAIIVSDLALPQRYPDAGGVADLQVGYRVHGITGGSLVSTKPGAWQPGWIVIATNEFAHPFFIDTADATRVLPVQYAPHGAGRWQPVCVAPSLRRFIEILAALRDLEGEDDRALRFIADETDPANPLWREVLQSRRERDALAAEIAGPAPDLADIANHDLVIVDVGPHRLKVVQILRHALGLDMANALALATQHDIAVRRAPKVQLRRLQAELAEAGATLELRACHLAKHDQAFEQEPSVFQDRGRLARSIRQWRRRPCFRMAVPFSTIDADPGRSGSHRVVRPPLTPTTLLAALVYQRLIGLPSQPMRTASKSSTRLD